MDIFTFFIVLNVYLNNIIIFLGVLKFIIFKSFYRLVDSMTEKTLLLLISNSVIITICEIPHFVANDIFTLNFTKVERCHHNLNKAFALSGG